MAKASEKGITDPKKTKAEKKQTRKIEKKMETFCSLPFVSEMGEAECDCLSRISSVVTLKKGEILITQGKKDDSLYVVIKGRLKVNRSTGGGESVTLACIREGEMAGAMGFLDGSEHNASLESDATTSVLRIKRKDLEAILDKHPQTVYKLMRAIAREIHKITSNMNLQFVEMQNYINKQHGRY